MKTNLKSLKWVFQFAWWAFLVSAVALALPGAADAATVTVDCDDPGTADYDTINDALAALSLEGPNTINVLPGNCVENIVIENRERLTIDAPDGQVIITPADPDQQVITIVNSRGIVLRTIAANNSSRNGIVVSLSSGVLLDGVATTQNGDNGVWVGDHSSVYFFANADQNGNRGLFVAEHSYALVQGANLTNNSSGGIVAAGNSRLEMLGGNSVTNNGGIGVVVRDNSSATLSGNTITGNSREGVVVAFLSSTRLSGPNTITGNGNSDLACSTSSLAYGNASGVGKLLCPGFSTDPFPGPLM